jgi:putative sigma-54 modulation protein
MNIEFVGRHVALDDRIRKQAEEKIGRIAKLLREPVEVHVTLESEKFRQMAEVRVRQRRGELLAREEATDLGEALNLAVDKIDGQARRRRERNANRRRRAARNAAPRAAGAVAAGGAES